MSVDPRIVEDPITRPLGAAQRFGDAKRALQNLNMKAGQVSSGYAQLSGAARSQLLGYPTRAGLTGAQTITPGSTKIVLDSAASPGFDPYNDWDLLVNFRWTASTNGIYQIFGTISATSTGAALTTLQAAIFKNGAIALNGSSATTSTAGQLCSAVVHGFVSMSAFDYIELYGVSSGGNLTITNTIVGTSVSIMQIA